MRINEAIRVLEYALNAPAVDTEGEAAKAIQLGVEALKRLKEHREDHIDITHRNLPGETQ